jgi:hypothetical protein
MRNVILGAVGVSVAFASASASAAVLAQYNLDSVPSDSTTPYSAESQDISVSTTPLTVGPDLAGYTNVLAGHFDATGWPVEFNANDAYISFSIAPTTGNQIEYSSMTFTWKLESPESATKLAVRSSVDGYGSDLFNATYDPGSTAPHAVNVDLSGLAPQSGQVQFRFYGYGDGNGSTGGALAGLHGAGQGGSPLVVNGTLSPVPEPASMALLMLGAGGLLVTRRRQA